MKIKIISFSLFILTIFSLSKVHALVKDLPLLDKVIYLDAGHGGVDCGAISGNYEEKDINLQITLKLAESLGSKGAIVMLTRDDDYDLASPNVSLRKRSDLANRAKMINDVNPDMYISIHLNSSTSSSWRGLQIFYSNVNPENEIIATSINDYLKTKTSNIREIKKDNSYLMYRTIKSPGILIEAGFISNPSDLYLLKQEDYQQKLAGYITEAVIDYYKKKN